MGNYISCTLITPTIKSSKAARVIFPTGEVRQFREPLKAAELMLESPNFFLVNSKSLHMGRSRHGGVLVSCNSAAKRISGGKVRILPESGGDGSEEVAVATAAVENEAGCSRLNLDEVEGFPVSEYKYRLAMFRSKKPLLETIREEPVCSR
ncbi:hypothetical protein CK203_070695 [Vitis vinifera]|uniref:Uncharacterized protein n=1 Tax=Vitis vinifera TaxID=29760 RepID=A0A438C279_VITVI|nr:hypothetical protein CK203_070695 [Vitis vinifera]